MGCSWDLKGNCVGFNWMLMGLFDDVRFYGICMACYGISKDFTMIEGNRILDVHGIGLLRAVSSLQSSPECDVFQR